MLPVSGNSVLLATVLSVSWMVVESTNSSCNFHRNLWCSSLQIARICGVEAQCMATVWSTQTNAPKVNVSIYYEYLCPGCMEMITKDLWHAFSKIPEIFNFELIPYGNAYEKQVGEKWEFDCQHGPIECLGNMIETCAIHVTGSSAKAYPFIRCLEDSDDVTHPYTIVPLCGKMHGVNSEAVIDCANSSLGNQLEHQMAVRTEKLSPPHEYVPWITLNGVYDPAQMTADLFTLICKTYTGVKPKACLKEKTIETCPRS